MIVVAVKSLHPANPDDIPVAEVGDRVITLRDFRMNYEFGFPSLKVGKELFERRRSYLNAMVNEMLLATEGYRLGLDKHQRGQDNDRDMVTDLLTDALIQMKLLRRQQFRTMKFAMQLINRKYKLKSGTGENRQKKVRKRRVLQCFHEGMQKLSIVFFLFTKMFLLFPLCSNRII